MIHSLPKDDGYINNVCAFCHYWEGEARLHSHGTSQVEFDGNAKGRCITKGIQKNANAAACQKYQISNDASRYCKR